MYLKELFPCILVAAISTFVKAVHHSKSTPINNLSPINIDTSKVTSVNTTTPFTVYSDALSLDFVTNTGNAIHFEPLPFSRTHVTGGFLKNVVYSHCGDFLFINQNGSRSRSGYTIDGVGYPIEGVILYFNTKYATCEKAMEHDDGLIVISEPTEVNSKHNPKFEPLEKVLRSEALKEPNSSTLAIAKHLFDWYDTILISHSYFAFSGSFYDPRYKKQVSSATCIVTQPPYNHISYDQFTAFQNVLGFDKKPIETIAPIYPAASRTIQGAVGAKMTPLPFGQIVVFLQLGLVIISKLFG